MVVRHADPDDRLDDRLRAWVWEDFGVELVAVTGVDRGADVAAEVWRGVADGGAQYAIKRSGGGSPAGLLVPAWLGERGVPGVVAPVPTRSGNLWSEREGRRLSLVPWVSGSGALDGGMTACHWVSYGTLLARVHALTPGDPVAEVLPREERAHRRWTSLVSDVDKQVRAAAESADQLVRALTEEWAAVAELVAVLLGAAEDLSSDHRVRRAARVVCHGDAHLGNVVVGEGGRVWLIDWDDAVLAPREQDLLFVLGGVLPFAQVSSQEQAWFFDGYGPVDVDPARLAYHQCVRALEDFAVPAAQVLAVGREPEPERADALAIFRSVFSPTGLATLALSSLRDLGLTR
ncbi:phosphotransferase enzyme family protein [Streptoalloteichus hindustanus]|uniref:Spectinomycin phosphotransferase n=1 Tax=Streptoalloteichus hindustanus TaxID=2017 RepID=A0A1M5F659_STRHI|nr:phosphotransferase [Streptoalloteichus hindustanus]SHF86967.1 spectinomycin phosphotransferase [Streptoalloteichus hindustanus]